MAKVFLGRIRVSLILLLVAEHLATNDAFPSAYHDEIVAYVAFCVFAWEYCSWSGEADKSAGKKKQPVEHDERQSRQNWRNNTDGGTVRCIPPEPKRTGYKRIIQGWSASLGGPSPRCGSIDFAAISFVSSTTSPLVGPKFALPRWHGVLICTPLQKLDKG